MKNTKLGKGLAKGLKEAVDFKEGKIKLRTTTRDLDKELLINKIDFVIYEFATAQDYSLNRTVDHFIKLKKRIQKGQKLTKKMQEQLEWINKSVKDIK